LKLLFFPRRERGNFIPIILINPPYSSNLRGGRREEIERRKGRQSLYAKKTKGNLSENMWGNVQQMSPQE
jgi:hypothetical protein